MLCGVTIKDRIRNEEIRRLVWLLSDLSGRVDKCVLWWFGHMERMDGERNVKMVDDSEVDRRRNSLDGWNEKWRTLEQARVTVDDIFVMFYHLFLNIFISKCFYQFLVEGP